jgi:hypothetical protein
LDTNALKKGLQTADELVFELINFRDRRLKFKHEMKAVMAPYKVCKNMQKKK